MWAYYAESHRGCVLEFDTAHPFFANNRGLTRVRYESSRPVHRYGGSGDWAYQKSKEWEHEAEWRMMGELSTLEKSGTDHHGNAIYLASFPPEALTAIYLCIRMSADDIQRYEELVRKPNRQHIKLSKVRPDPEHFALCFDPHLTVSG